MTETYNNLGDWTDTDSWWIELENILENSEGDSISCEDVDDKMEKIFEETYKNK